MGNFFAHETHSSNNHRTYSRKLLTRISREQSIPDIPGFIGEIQASINLFRYTISKPGKKKKTPLPSVAEEKSDKRPVSAPVERDPVCTLIFNRVSDTDLDKLADLIINQEEKIPEYIRKNRSLKLSYYVDIENVHECRPKTEMSQRDFVVNL